MTWFTAPIVFSDGSVLSASDLNSTVSAINNGTVTVSAGGLGLAVAAIGSIPVGSSTSAYTLLSIGAAGTLPRSTGTTLAYTTATYPATATRGDVLVATAANTVASLAVGAAGKILRSDGTDILYTTATFPNTATQGDLLIATAANTWTPLAAGTSGQYLKTQGAGANPLWATHQGVGARAKITLSAGAPSLNGAVNITSITDNGVGDFTLNFTSNAPDTNYTYAPGNLAAASRHFNLTTQAVGSFRYVVVDTAGAAADSDHSMTFFWLA